MYWNSNTKLLLSGKSDKAITDKMLELILKDDLDHPDLDYIVSVSATSTLSQNDPDDATNLTMRLDLEPLYLQLYKPQLENIIKTSEILNSFSKFNARSKAQHERKKSSNPLALSSFTEMLKKIQMYDKQNDLKEEEKIHQALENEAQIREFKRTLIAIRDEELVIVVKGVAEELEVERCMQKKKGIKGWFSSKFKIGSDIQEKFGASQEVYKDADISKRTSSFVFRLKKGSIGLFNDTVGTVFEGVAFDYKELNVALAITSNGKSVKASLNDISLTLQKGSRSEIIHHFLKEQSSTDVRPFSDFVLQKLERLNTEKKSFLKVAFGQNDKENSVDLEAQALRLIYRPLAIERLLKFFNVAKNNDSQWHSEAANNQNADTAIDKPSEEPQSSGASGAVKNIITVKISSPDIIIPFTRKPDTNQPCWVLHLGDFGVSTKDSDINQDLYESYKMALSKINFTYYNTQAIYILDSEGSAQKSLKPEGQLSGSRFSIIENFRIEVGVRIANKGLEIQNKDDPMMDVNVRTSNIHLQLKPKIYYDLLRAQDILAYSNQEHAPTNKPSVHRSEEQGRPSYRDKNSSELALGNTFVAFNNSDTPQRWIDLGTNEMNNNANFHRDLLPQRMTEMKSTKNVALFS